MSEIKPVTADQVYLAKAAGGDVELPKPVTANQMFLAKMAGMDVQTPPPVTADQMFMQKIIDSGGGGSCGVVNICESTEPTEEIVSGFSQVGAIRFPNAETIGEYAFASGTALTSVDLPVATSIGNHAFVNCTALTSVDLPAATSIGEYAFASGTALTSVDLPVATSIGDSAFWLCTALDTLILRNTETVCELIATAVMGTKIVTAEGMPTGEGFIYVHAKFYDDYVTLIAYQAAMLLVSQGMGEAEAQATADYIARAILRKIEDYPEICG